MSEEVQKPAPRATARNKRERPEELQASPEAASKKIKTDHDAQVSQLFASKNEQGNSVDMHQKKLVFKIINGLKDGQNKCHLNAIWKRYLAMGDRE